ncbi:MAG: type II toxin-antitoxin system Phd/YefM family antitoxin [Kiritimatiellae bacterium]|jgi:prevent-host-death family protein|nr:type II toxin-antitoxin system Phd/YefM family antitoxin [Kiritimatiellia bacterium]
MKTMAISQFKTHALKVIDQLSHNHESIVVTKRGKPLALITPYEDSSKNIQPGQLSNTFVFEEDIISPIGEDMWEVCS